VWLPSHNARRIPLTRDSDKCSLLQRAAFLFLSFAIVRDLCKLKNAFFLILDCLSRHRRLTVLGWSKCLRGIILTKQGMWIRLIYQAAADKDPWLNAAHGKRFCNGQQRAATGLAPSCCRYTQLPSSTKVPHRFTPARCKSPSPLLYATLNNVVPSAEWSLD